MSPARTTERPTETFRVHEGARLDAAPRPPGTDVPIERTTNEARQAVTGHNVRYVLGFGLVAVIIGFVIAFLIERGHVF